MRISRSAVFVCVCVRFKKFSKTKHFSDSNLKFGSAVVVDDNIAVFSFNICYIFCTIDTIQHTIDCIETSKLTA